MKLIISFLLVFSSSELSSQELKCLDFNLYNSERDIIGVQSSSELNVELKPDSLQIIVTPDLYLEFPKWTTYKRIEINSGFKVLLVNNTTEDFNLANLDGRIIIKRQVYYNDEWTYVKSFKKNIGIRCGNSYFHDAIIEPGQIMTYVAPCIDGDIKVKFRFVAFVKTEGIAIYSNEFDGFINESLIK